MFHMYLLVGCVTVGVICLVAYELDQHAQANQRRREYEQRQHRMRHSYASAPGFKQGDQDDKEQEEQGEVGGHGKSSGVEVGGDEKSAMSTATGLHQRRRSATGGTRVHDAEELRDHNLVSSTFSKSDTVLEYPSDYYLHSYQRASTTASAFLDHSGTTTSSSNSDSAYLTSHSHSSHLLTSHHHLADSNTDSDRQIFTPHSRHDSFNNDDDLDSASDSATEPLFEQRAPSRAGARSPDEDWVRL